MARARWFVVGFLLTAAVVGGLVNARGPFDAHPALAYDRLSAVSIAAGDLFYWLPMVGGFIADFQAGRVEQIVQWRDQLEVTEQGALRSVVVPPERDLAADLAQARLAGGVGINHATLPDAWLGVMTPWVPFLLALAALLIWVTAVVRSRMAASGAGPAGSSQPAG